MRVVTTFCRVSSHLLRAAFLKGSTLKKSDLTSLCSIVQHTETECAFSFLINGRFLSSSSVVDSFLEYERDQQCDDGKVEEKNATLHLALSQLVVDFDRDSNLSLHRFFCKRWAPVIPTGSLKLDQALGIGGLPKGRMVEIYGKEACGKTTLALHIVKEAQKLGAEFDGLKNILVPGIETCLLHRKQIPSNYSIYKFTTILLRNKMVEYTIHFYINPMMNQKKNVALYLIEMVTSNHILRHSIL